MLDGGSQFGIFTRSAQAATPMTNTPTKTSIGLVLALTACLLLAAGPAATAQTATTDPEVQVLEMVNTIREQRGLHLFEMNRRLSRQAERHSRAMARTRRLTHSGKIRSGMAENVGVGSSLEVIVEGWMSSADHRRNLLGPYRQAGVGVQKAGRLFWVTLILR
jgi:uncharacterized protein YkwD